jgi:hypothetical protein
MIKNPLIQWLLDGDVSIQYQVNRDLLDTVDSQLQERIATEGWGARFLSFRNANGHWGLGYYQPKWTSTHYTLQDIRNLCLSPQNENVRQTVALILKNHKGTDGGINPAKMPGKSDVCVNGMFLNYASYFGADQTALQSVVDFILSQHMHDGGFNCHSNFKGAMHSSLHTTLSIIEGILEYSRNGYPYRLAELTKARKQSEEFILLHRLYKSHRTGEIINSKMLLLSYPSRWYYNILRALDYFRDAGAAYDNRMEDALSIVLKKRRPDNKWPLQAKHMGKTHFEMESGGQSSRWNTLRAMRVLKHFGI